MAEVHTKSRKIVDENGKTLFVETATVLVDGEEVHIESERRVSRCPTCGSRLDKVEIIGQCYECNAIVCSNCGIKAHCCNRTLCEEHRYLAIFKDRQMWCCEEHAPHIASRQKLYDVVVFRNQKLKEEVQHNEIDLKSREMRVKESTISFQRALASRQQACHEAETRQRLYLEHSRLHIQQLQAVAPNAYRLLSNYGSRRRA